MVNQRDRILRITDYLIDLGLNVNICKNKARGNRGFFGVKQSQYRIDIAKGLPEEVVLQTLVHEFAHFVHYTYDKSLKSLEFIFPNNEIITEELLKVTVDLVPRETVKPIFDIKTKLSNDIDELTAKLKQIYPNFENNKPFNLIEDKIKNSPNKYLLKHDRVKVVDFFQTKFYDVDNFDGALDLSLYLKLKSKQRALKRVNSKINRMNKYYNSPTELFARSFEQFVFNPNFLEQNTPNLYFLYLDIIENDKIPIITNFIKKFK